MKKFILSLFIFSITSVSFAHLKWSIEMPGLYSTGATVDKSGTVYLSNTHNDLFAISKEGKVLWTLSNIGAHPSLGLDGTIYVASTLAVNAITPEGKIKWSFKQDPGALMIFGPEVGPDGFIYAVATEGLGPFALSPEGQLRWHGCEKYNRQNTPFAKITFGLNERSLQLYYYANNAFKAIKARTGEVLSGFTGGMGPLAAPNGNIHIGTRAYDPSGKYLWNADIPASYATLLDIDRLGNSYYNEYSTKLHMASSDGKYLRSMSLTEGNYLTSAKSSPKSDVVVLTFTNSIGTSLLALETAHLKKLWSHDFGSKDSWPVVGHLEAFDSEGDVLYSTSTSAAYGDKFYLHSFRLK